MKLINLFIFSLILIIPTAVLGQDVISAKEALNASKKGATLISARNGSDYSKVHAMGAVNIDPATLVDELSMLKPLPELTAALGAKGISNGKTLLIYDDGSMKNAGRLYWMFKYLGVNDVKVVNGGMKAWRIGRLPVTKNPTLVKKGTFKATVKPQYLADFGYVKKSLTTALILDVRSPEEFNDPEGRIMNAINMEFKEVLMANGNLKSQSEIEALFKSKGITKNKNVIVYCRSSVRAGIVFLALKGLDYPNVRVYDGAFIEWKTKAPKNIETE